jgi:hypothetical protein
MPAGNDSAGAGWLWPLVARSSREPISSGGLVIWRQITQSAILVAQSSSSDLRCAQKRTALNARAEYSA